MLFCILEHIYILRDPLYLKVVALHLIMQRQKVKFMPTRVYHLHVSEQRLWLDVGVEGLRVSEFPHPSVFDNGKDKLRRPSMRRLVGSAVRVLSFV